MDSALSFTTYLVILAVDSGITPISAPKGPGAFRKFYRFTKLTRLQTTALLTSNTIIIMVNAKSPPKVHHARSISFYLLCPFESRVEWAIVK